MNASLPARAEHVGSLLRPPKLELARERHSAGKLGPEDLRDAEDQCIAELVARQESLGLGIATDGEARRTHGHLDFLAALEGVELAPGGDEAGSNEASAKGARLAIAGRIGLRDVPMLEDFRFLKSVVRHAVPKLTIPAPPMLHFHGGRESIGRKAYPDLEQLFADIAETYKRVLHAFYAAGCRYLQLDDTAWAHLAADAERERSRQRGDDPSKLPAIYAETINAVLAVKPADMTVTTHVCRGSLPASRASTGGYEPMAETLLAGIDYDGYVLEHDAERTGGFEPLRFLPKGKKRVVLGLVTSRTAALERRDLLERRIEEATRYADIDQLCLSPQCGFAAAEARLTQDDQWRKIDLVLDTAARIWRDA